MKCNFVSRKQGYAKIGWLFLVLMVFALGSLGLTAVAKPKPADSSSLPMAKPESEGFSSERLQRIKVALQKHIDAGEVSGVVTLIAKNGHVVYFEAQGLQDIADKKPMQKDMVFNIASASKPITAVAILMMVEEGKLHLNDPVGKFIPEFKGLKVRPLKQGEKPTATTEMVAATHDITIRDLLTHTSGLMSIGVPKPEAPQPDELLQSNLAAFVPRFATPLDFQPGTKWAYSNWAGFDVLGRIVEIVSGKTFDQFLKERIFEPLGMKDTWYAPKTDYRAARLATRYQMTPNGLRPLDPPTPYSASKTYFSGAAGLSSTAEDYFRFSQMLANGGELNGKRLLSPYTVQLMTSNHVGDLYATSGRGRSGEGFGLGVSMITDRNEALTLVPNGTFGWPGATGCEGSVSPKEGLVMVFMVPAGNFGPTSQDFKTTAMQALLK